MTGDSEIRRFDSADEVLGFAIEKEREAFEFYTNWAKEPGSDAIREVFGEFAREERKHERMLLDVRAGGAFEASGEVADLKLTDYFVDVQPKPGMTYQDALLLAIRREREARAMYESLAGSGLDPALTALFEDLARMEAEHKLKLEALYDDGFMKED